MCTRPFVLVALLSALSLFCASAATAQQAYKAPEGEERAEKESENQTPKQSETPSELFEISWAKAYTPAPEALLEELNAQGMTAEGLRALDDPETPSATVIMILDAASRGAGAEATARQLLRAWGKARGESALKLDRLTDRQLLALAYLGARAKPKTLEALGGDSEVERLSPMTLAAAAASRRRGDMATRVVLGMIKAQDAANKPDEALCASRRECIAEAVSPFVQEWSVAPELICALVAGDQSGVKISGLNDPLAFCDDPDGRKERPLFVEQAREQDAARHAASSPAPPQHSSAQPMFKGGVTSSAAVAAATVQLELLLEQLKIERSRVSGLERVMLDTLITELERELAAGITMP